MADNVPREVFDEDYDVFYAELLTPERSARDAELIQRLCRLEPGERVLDVPCGDGRIAVRLAEAGLEVVGIDREERFVERARAAAPPGASFEAGDMRALDRRGEFDCVVNWFSSFGYFDTATNQAVLRSFREALRSGGRLILDQANPERLRRGVEAGGGSFVHMAERGQDLLVDRVTMVGEHRSLTERFVVRGGRVRRLEFELEQLPADELERWLRDAGLDDVRVYGDGGAPFRNDSRRLIAVASPAT